MTEARLYLLQRGSAMLLAPLVLIHLALILYAVRDGLSAAEILDRTRGSVAWALFYGLFVAAVAVHAPIGLRNLAREWLAWHGPSVNVAVLAVGLVLLTLGIRAVWAVVGGGA
jgi:fumarate reductase subunit C